MTVHANAAGEATLLLTRDRGEAQTRTVTLRKGENTFAFDMAAGEAGVSTVEAQVLLAGDRVSANDTGGAFTVVAGAPSVLIAEGRSGEGAALESMLEAAGMTVRRMPANMLPGTAADLLLRALHARKPLHGDLFAVGEARSETGERRLVPSRQPHAL